MFQKREKLSDLLKILIKEEGIAKRRFEENKHAANETSKTSRTSWSAAGEREYAQGQVQIIEDYFQKVKRLKEVVEESLGSEIPLKIEAPCFINTEIDGVRDEFYLVKDPVNIPEVKFVSEESLLGSAILGKKESDTFSYQIEERKINGKILKVE